MNVTLTIPKTSTFTKEEFTKCMSDPLYFVSTYCWTFDPRPEAAPHHLPFHLYEYQKEALLTIIWHIKNGQDLLIEKSRDMGVTWIVLAALLWCWEFMPGFQALLGSRKEDLVDSRKLEALFPKLDYMMEKLPFQPEGFQPERDRTHMTLLNPMNKNAIGGESANQNFARQGRYTVAVMDELPFWESPETAWVSAGESTRCRIAICTPPRKVNFAKYLRFSGKVKVLTLHWRLHPKKDEAWYESQKLRKLPEEVAQELDINWEGAITGRVYPEVDHIVTGHFQYRADWPLYVSHDPGHHPDPHAVGWFQVNPETGRVRMLEAFEGTNKLAEWFMPFFGHPIDSQFVYTSEELSLISKTSQWKKGIHVGDVYGRTKNQVTGTSVYDEFQKFHIYVQSNTIANDLESRKTATRRVLMNFEVNETPNTRYFMECLKSARYPELSENSNRITANDKPIHDWTSHMRTMLEFFAVNYTGVTYNEPELPGATFAKAFERVQLSNQDPDIIE